MSLETHLFRQAYYLSNWFLIAYYTELNWTSRSIVTNKHAAPALNTLCKLSTHLLALSILISHLWWILLIPVDDILVSQYHNMTLTVAVLHTFTVTHTLCATQILLLTYLHATNTHTHTRLMDLFPGLPRWAGTRKVKPIWILLKQETVSGNGISWAICKSALRFRQTTTPETHHSLFYRADALPAAQPTASKHWRESAINGL